MLRRELSEGWKKIAKKQGSDTARRSKPMHTIGDTYVNTVLIPRIEALLKDPNGTYLKDMGITFDATEGVTQDMKDKLDKRWEETGEDRSRYYSHTEAPMTGEYGRGGIKGKTVWIYLEKNILQGMMDPFRQYKTTLDVSPFAERKTATTTLK